MKITIVVPVKHARNPRQDMAAALEQLARLYRSEASVPVADVIANEDKSATLGSYYVDFSC